MNINYDINSKVENQGVNDFFASKNYLIYCIVKTSAYVLNGLLGIAITFFLLNYLTKNIENIIALLEYFFGPIQEGEASSSGSSGGSGEIIIIILTWLLYVFAKKNKDLKGIFVVFRVLLGISIAGIIIALIASLALPVAATALASVPAFQPFAGSILLLTLSIIVLLIVSLIIAIKEFKLLKPFATDDPDILNKIPNLKNLKILHYVSAIISILLTIFVTTIYFDFTNSFTSIIKPSDVLSADAIETIKILLVDLQPLFYILIVSTIISVIPVIYTTITIKHFEQYVEQKKYSKKINILDF